MSETPPRTESELIEQLRAIDAPAPETLHREVRALVSERTHERTQTRVRGGRPAGGTPASMAPKLTPHVALSAAVALVVVVAILALTLAGVDGGSGGGASQAQSLRQTAALTLRSATLPAPAQSATDRTHLAAAVGGVSFPYWGDRFGWRATGARSDRVGGRMVTTVFYADAGGRRIGYAIVAGAAPPAPSGGTVVWRADTPYRLSTEDGAAVVTWRRDGHLCVLAGRGVGGATLLALASWGESS